MIKYIVAGVIGLGIWSLAQAGDDVSVPTSEVSNPIPADYGGVEIATNSFFVGLATVPSGVGSQGVSYRKFYASSNTVNNVYADARWTIYGAIFSPGNCTNQDFISIQVSSAGAIQAREVTRVYNNFATANSTGVICGGVSPLRWPIRVYGNLFWGVNVGLGGGVSANPFNRADLLYYREPE